MLRRVQFFARSTKRDRNIFFHPADEVEKAMHTLQQPRDRLRSLLNPVKPAVKSGSFLNSSFLPMWVLLDFQTPESLRFFQWFQQPSQRLQTMRSRRLLPTLV